MRQLTNSPGSSTRAPLMAVAALGVAAGLVLAAAPADAKGGPDPERLAAAGWFCFPHGGATHCTGNFEEVSAGKARTSTTLSFDAETGDYLGTELLIREDLYHGQPCPQDQSDGDTREYVHLSELGFPLPYYVCHHFESPVT